MGYSRKEVCDKLSTLKSDSLSIEGRLTLVKSVLSSLSLYFFSLLRVPPTICNHLEKCRNNFFWGYSSSNKRIVWAQGPTKFETSETGGLKVYSLQSKNLTLLEKGWWRYKDGKSLLWQRIISSFYGNDGGFNNLFLRYSEGPWAQIIKVGRDMDGLGLSFSSVSERKVA